MVSVARARGGGAPPRGTWFVWDGYALQLVNRQVRPQFSGHSKDWGKFVRDWENFQSLVREAQPLETSDTLMLSELRDCLDKASQSILSRATELNRFTTFEAVWDQLCRIHHYDPVQQSRQAWQALKFEYGGKRPSKQEFILFQTEFLRHRDRVPDWTPSEELTLLRREIPPYYCQQWHKEECKRKKREGWIKVEGAGLTAELASVGIGRALGLSPLRVLENRGFFWWTVSISKMKMIFFLPCKVRGWGRSLYMCPPARNT